MNTLQTASIRRCTALHDWMRNAAIVATVVLAIPASAAVAMPASGPDLNGDGAIDFCDYVVHANDLISNNLRSDFNADNVVNLSDTAILAQVYCTGPAKTAVAGTAIVGVYFDPAGTITQLFNVPASTVVDFYVVAHGSSGLGSALGYTFDVDENSTAFIMGENAPAGFTTVQGHDATLGKCSLGSLNNVCIGMTGTVVLNHYTLFYLGQDTTIEVLGLNECGAPSAQPSYVSCGVDGVPCDWTSFAYDRPNGQATITTAVADEAVSWSAVKALYR